MRLLMLLLAFLWAGALTAQLTLQPAQPQPGQAVTLEYDPAGTPLEGAAQVEARVYLCESIEDPRALDVPLERKGQRFVGTLELTPEARAVVLRFRDPESKKWDDHDKKGFTFLLHDEKGQPLPEAYLFLGNTLASYTYRTNLDPDIKTAIEHFHTAFKLKPALEEDLENWMAFAGVLRRSGDEAAKAEMRNKLDELKKKRRASEMEMYLAYALAQFLKQQEDADKLKEKISKKYPNGLLAANELINQIYDSRDDLQKQTELFEKFKKDFQGTKDYESRLSDLAASLANAYALKGDAENFRKYARLVTDKNTLAGMYNNTAWDLAGGGLEGEAQHLELAREMSAESLKLVEEMMNNPETRPIYFTKRQWESMNRNSLGTYADTYALILHKLGENEEALKYQTTACEIDEFQDADMNHRYCVYLEKVKGPEAAEQALEKFIAQAAATSKMKERYRELFLANHTVESAFEKYMAALEAKAYAKLKEEVAKKMMEKPAPDFSLVNLDGETYSLESLRGKTVVLDFWATWCGPCKASFPGMQKAQEQFADNPDVVFLFVNTWERAKDKRQNAADFIEKHGYPFNVLLDSESKVVEAFEVDGIPTKFVIGPDGVIRFQSVGYGGNDEKMIQELGIMIELAAEKKPAKLTGAP